MDGNIESTAELDRASHEHARACGGELEHFVKRDFVELASMGHQPWIGSVDALDVGVDLANIRLMGGCQRHCGGVRTSPAERGDLLTVGIDALKTGHDHNVPAVDALLDAGAPYLSDLGLSVGGISENPGLGAGQRDGRDVLIMERHRQKRHRNAFSSGEQHVHLPGGRSATHVVRQLDQIVCGGTHGRHHDNDIIAATPGVGDPTRHTLDPLGICDGGAAELLNNEGHNGPEEDSRTSVLACGGSTYRFRRGMIRPATGLVAIDGDLEFDLMATDKRVRQRENREKLRAERSRLARIEKMKRRGVFLIVILAVVATFAWLTNRDSGVTETPTTTVETSETTVPSVDLSPSDYAGFRAQPTACGAEQPEAIQEMSFLAPVDQGLTGTVQAALHTSCGRIDFSLDAAAAPESVNSFAFPRF